MEIELPNEEVHEDGLATWALDIGDMSFKELVKATNLKESASEEEKTEAVEKMLLKILTDYVQEKAQGKQ